jgi:chromosomal replication initiator protein
VSKQNSQDVWSKASKHLGDVLHEDVYSRWIEIIEPCSLEDGVLTLAVDNDFYKTWLEENYLSLIESAIGAVQDDQLKTAFVVESRGEVTTEEPVPEKKPTLTDRILGRRQQAKPTLNQKFTFDSFIVGSIDESWGFMS